MVINATSDQKLRGVERSNIGAAIRDFAQAAGHRDLRAFGLDDALDLIRKVSGHSSNSDFAEMLTGSRSLRFSKSINLSDVPDVASTAVAYFKSRAYKETSFRVIDFLSPVLDDDLIEELDLKLLSAIQKGSDEFEIAIAEILTDDAATFRFEHAGFAKFHPDVSLELYRTGLGDKLASITLNELSNHTVAAYASDEDRKIQHWSVYRSLVGSIDVDDQRYAFNEGFWYNVNTVYKRSAENKFSELVSDRTNSSCR